MADQDPGSDVTPWERVVLVAGVALVTVGAVLLLGGGLASLVAGGGWVWPPLTSAAFVIGGLAAHPGHPAAAYPEAMRHRVAGPAAFWSTEAVLLVTAAAATVFVLAWIARRRTEKGLATRRQIRASMHSGRADTTAPFASYRGTPVCARAEDSCVTVAPARAGKTTSLAAPRVVDAPGPVLATSTKVDLLRLTAGARATRGPVHVWDADRLTGWSDVARWDIVAGCADVREATGRARAMVAARPLAHVQNSGFFSATAETVLRCLLHAAALGAGSMRDVLDWSRNLDDDAPYDVLRTHPRAARGWADDLQKYCRLSTPETISNTDMSLGLVLSCLADPDVLDLVCPGAGQGIDVDRLVVSGVPGDSGSQGRGGRSGARVARADASTRNAWAIPRSERGPTPGDEELSDGPQTLFVLCEGGSGTSTAPLATALTSAVVRAARRASQRRGAGRLDPVFTFVLDEAPNVAPIPEMPLLISDGGGRGMPTWLFAQSFAQLRSRWGRDEADTMWGSAPIKMLLGGAAETDDLERLSRLLGERTVRRVSTSRGQGATWSQSSSAERERVLPVEAIRQLGVGQALMVYRNLPPAVVDLPAWWQRADAEVFRAAQEWAQARDVLIE